MKRLYICTAIMKAHTHTINIVTMRVRKSRFFKSYEEELRPDKRGHTIIDSSSKSIGSSWRSLRGGADVLPYSADTKPLREEKVEES